MGRSRARVRTREVEKKEKEKSKSKKGMEKNDGKRSSTLYSGWKAKKKKKDRQSN
jgi:hypothetical protein